MAFGVCDARTLIESEDYDFLLAMQAVTARVAEYRELFDERLATKIIVKLGEAMKA